jgi:chromosome segregation ATPase
MSAIEDGAMQDKDVAQTDDLVKRLRGDGEFGYGVTGIEAADALESQSAELTRLRERNKYLEEAATYHAKWLDNYKTKIGSLRERNAELTKSYDLAMRRSNAWREQAEKAEAREAEMSDDIETLRDIITHHMSRESLAALESLVAERNSLRKALDDRYEADKKAAKAIFAATGRKWGFPPNKEVVAFLIAENDRLKGEIDLQKLQMADTLKLIGVHLNKPVKE